MTQELSFNEPATLELVLSAQAGDAAARERLFARYLPRVRQIVAIRMRRAARDLETVEDLVQESLLKALDSLDGFKERSEGTFRNWMARCVQSAVIDHFRSQKTLKRGAGKVRRFTEIAPESLASSIFISDAPSPSKVVSDREEEARLESALLKLDDHYREVIVLVKLCGMSYSEAARAMGFRTPGSAGQVLHRAIQKLKEALGANGSS